MSKLADEFLVACEVHSVSRLQAVLDAGFDVRAPLAGQNPVMTLVEMYYRSDAFPACLALLLGRPAVVVADDVATEEMRIASRFLNRRPFGPLHLAEAGPADAAAERAVGLLATSVEEPAPV